MMPLVAVGIWVIIRHSGYLIRETQTQTLRAQAVNITCSARAWADLHKAQILAAPPEQTFRPDLSGLQIRRGSCQINILSQTPSGCTVEITAVARSGANAWTEKRSIGLSR